MNIKIENELRVRLDQIDVQSLLQQKAIERKFSIGQQFLFNLHVVLEQTDPSASMAKSFVEITSQKFLVHLTLEDLEKLQQKEFQKNGIVVCEDPRIEVQVDLFTDGKKHKLN